MPRLPTDENSFAVENQKRLLRTFGQPRFDTVMPCLPMNTSSVTTLNGTIRYLSNYKIRYSDASFTVVIK